MYTAKQIKKIIDERDLSIQKGRGQNFLVDENTVRKMISLCEFTPVDTVVEIGAGLGNFTGDIAEEVRQILAVEIDEGYCDFMAEHFDAPMMTIEQFNAREGKVQGLIVILKGNALDLDPALIAEEKRGVVIFGNLPYCETSPILFHLLEGRRNIDRMYVLVQKEVAERVVARPGAREKAYGRMSVVLQTFFEAEVLMNVNRTVFMPRPDVRSAFVRMVPKREPFASLEGPLPEDFEQFFVKVVAQAFAKRRKMLRTSFPEGFPEIEPARLDKVFLEEGIDNSRRGESLSIEEFHRLAWRLYIEKTGEEMK